MVTGPVNIDLPDCCRIIRVETAVEMQEAVLNSGEYDIAIFVAAVGDWRVKSISAGKIKKIEGTKPPDLDLIENPDILKAVCSLQNRPELIIGFAAETDDVVANATAKRLRKACDWIVANDVSPGTSIMGGSENAITLITEAGAESWPRLPKTEVAQRLAQRIVDMLRG